MHWFPSTQAWNYKLTVVGLLFVDTTKGYKRKQSHFVIMYTDAQFFGLWSRSVRAMAWAWDSRVPHWPRAHIPSILNLLSVRMWCVFCDSRECHTGQSRSSRKFRNWCETSVKKKNRRCIVGMMHRREDVSIVLCCRKFSPRNTHVQYDPPPPQSSNIVLSDYIDKNQPKMIFSCYRLTITTVRSVSSLWILCRLRFFFFPPDELNLWIVSFVSQRHM